MIPIKTSPQRIQTSTTRMNPPAQHSHRFHSAQARTVSSACRATRSAVMLVTLLAAPFSLGQTASSPDQERRPAAVAPSSVDAQTNRSRFYGGMSLGAAHHQDVVSSNNDGS